MDKNIEKLVVNIGGSTYSMQKQHLEGLSAELGITEERFVELLARDAYCPLLEAAPTASTLTYTDTDGSTNHFSVGQPCVYKDASISDGYGIAMLKAVKDGVAVWQDMRADMTRLEAVEKLASQAYSDAQLALEYSDEAKNTANAAIAAVATLEGLADTTTAQETLAAQVTQIAQNTEDVAQLKETLANQVLTIEMTEDGDVNILTGEGNTMFHDGYIEDSGEVVLELIY